MAARNRQSSSLRAPSIRRLTIHGRPGQNRVALLLVNVQNDFMEGGAVSVPGANKEFVDKLNHLRHLVPWDVVVHSRSYHPSNQSTFVSNNPGSQHGSTIRVGEEDVVTVNDHCLQGDLGSEPPAGLETTARDIVVERGTDPSERSLGSFLDPATRLKEFFELSGVGTVFIAGMLLRQHVQPTAQQALVAGVEPLVVEDLCLDLESGESELQESIVIQRAILEEHFALSVVQRPCVPVAPPPAFDTVLEYAMGNSDLVATVQEHVQSKTERSWTVEPSPITGRCLIHDICCIRHPNAVTVLRMLVNAGVDVNDVSSVVEMSPLAYACKHGCVEAVRFLCSQPSIQVVSLYHALPFPMCSVLFLFLSTNRYDERTTVA